MGCQNSHLSQNIISEAVPLNQQPFIAAQNIAKNQPLQIEKIREPNLQHLNWRQSAKNNKQGDLEIVKGTQDKNKSKSELKKCSEDSFKENIPFKRDEEKKKTQSYKNISILYKDGKDTKLYDENGPSCKSIDIIDNRNSNSNQIQQAQQKDNLSKNEELIFDNLSQNNGIKQRNIQKVQHQASSHLQVNQNQLVRIKLDHQTAEKSHLDDSAHNINIKVITENGNQNSHKQ